MTQDPNSAPAWQARIAACKTERQRLVSEWQINVAYRAGQPFAAQSTSDRISVNVDWSMTRAKHAALFSQTPSVTVSSSAGANLSQFSKLLNDRLTKAGAGPAIDEAVIDCINASGIGAALVAYEARTEEIDVPTVDGMMASLYTMVGRAVPTTKQKRVTSARFLLDHVSPDDLLWDTTFVGSDFDKANWVGRSGRVFWDDAKRLFGLKDTDREKVCGDAKEPNALRDTSNQTQPYSEPSMVSFDEIWFRQTSFDASAKYFDGIQRLVFVNGIEKPVIDEPWNGQRFDEQTGQYAGSCKFPLRILTLSFISNDPIPPSDSQIGRPQVDEINAHRTSLLLNRKRSIPIRWADPSRVDPLVMSKLMRGDIQDVLPIVNGAAAIGEVARAAFPREDHDSAQIARQDLTEGWSLGANQLGQFASGERSATEAASIAQSNNSRIGYERARVAKFFTGVAEVMGGLVVLYDPAVPDEARQRLGAEFSYTVRPDSTVFEDASTRFQKLSTFLNLTMKSGLYDPASVIQEMAALASVNVELKPPHPPQPEEPNISIRFSGEDLMNPAVIALLQSRGVIPPPQSPQPAIGQNPADMGPGLERITKRTDEV